MRGRRHFFFASASTLVAFLVLSMPLGAQAPQTITQTPVPSINNSIYGPNNFGFGYPGYGIDRYGGYLYGSASVINAGSRLMLDTQQAYLMQEGVKSAKLENLRRKQEQWLWERENLPTREQMRQEEMSRELERARNDPPFTEILYGSTLNNLLRDAQRIQSNSVPAGNYPLNPDVIGKINVTTGRDEGNLGVLRDGKMRWSLLLKRPEFEARRKRIDDLIAIALKQGARDDIDPDVLQELFELVRAFQDELVARIRTLPTSQWSMDMYLSAKRDLEQLDKAARLLRKSDAVHYLTGKYAAKGKTIGELVEHMRDSGLQFAPATEGGESAYRVLYNALREYSAAAGAPTGKERR